MCAYYPMRAKRLLLSCAFAGVMASGLLPGTSNDALAQLCTCAEPGWMNCSLMGFHSHEPATAAFPQCQLRSRRAAPPPSRSTTTRPQIDTAPSDSNAYNPARTYQIRPLPCPQVAPVRFGETFYGGSRCAPAAQEKNLQQAFQRALDEDAKHTPEALERHLAAMDEAAKLQQQRVPPQRTQQGSGQQEGTQPSTDGQPNDLSWLANDDDVAKSVLDELSKETLGDVPQAQGPAQQAPRSRRRWPTPSGVSSPRSIRTSRAGRIGGQPCRLSRLHEARPLGKARYPSFLEALEGAPARNSEPAASTN